MMITCLKCGKDEDYDCTPYYGLCLECLAVVQQQRREAGLDVPAQTTQSHGMMYYFPLPEALEARDKREDGA